MKRFFAILPAFMLMACQDSDIYKVGTVLVASVTDDPEKITRDRAAAVPYASMGLELGSTPELLLVLGTNTAGELDWYAGDQVFVRTRNGRITRTVGLPFDLGGLRELPAPKADVKAPIAVATQYSLDFPDIGIFGAAANCARRSMADEAVMILGSAIPAVHIVDHCTVSAMRWNFDNEYWIDRGNGYVWRSIQHIHPKSPPVVLEVFRPEQNPG
jgi:hypothetical protein